MKQKVTVLIVFSFFALSLNGTVHLSFADDNNHKEKSWHHKLFDWDDDDDDHDSGKHRKRHHSKGHGEKYIKPVTDATYKTECGACHFVYQPELLPSASWIKILDQVEDHFGEEIELDLDSKKIISDYLKSNSAEKSTAKRAVKIMRSLGNHMPMRISEIPYIRKKHHELSPKVFKRDSIGSLSNCIACHTTAEKGIYEDDNVKIPR